jgi:hypothetical protein
MRQGTFKVIEPIANKDEIYRLGVEAAPLFIKEEARKYSQTVCHLITRCSFN